MERIEKIGKATVIVWAIEESERFLNLARSGHQNVRVDECFDYAMLYLSAARKLHNGLELSFWEMASLYDLIEENE